jgi:hypothetical protein
LGSSQIRGKIDPSKNAINVIEQYTHHSIHLFFPFLVPSLVSFFLSRDFVLLLSEAREKAIVAKRAG